MRVIQLKKVGIQAFLFGKMDKKDFIIPPFVAFYIYILLGSTFQWPIPGTELNCLQMMSILGIVLCLLGLLLFIYALISFGKNFRVGLDENHPGKLVTSGAFAISRNPIYVSFAFVLLGNFFIIPNWILLLYVVAGIWLLNRQIKREEESLQSIFGAEYKEYCWKVRRFL